jgi:RNA polymerase sigma-54 factor
MTQQLQQSIKLLQATALELQAFVDLELEKNPFLTQEEEEGDEAPQVAAIEESPREADFSGDENYSADMPSQENGDDSHEIETDYLSTSHTASSRAAGDFEDEDGYSLEKTAAHDVTLREHLFSQLQADITDPVQRMIGAYLVDLVDEAGYIKDDFKSVADMLDAEISDVEEALAVLQSFEPAGVCARNLAECLSLQLKEKNRFDPAMQTLVANLSLLADSKFSELQKKCGVDLDDLKQMIGEIRALNPKPGSNFVREVVQAMEPDIFVRRLPDGNWHVELNMNNFPKVMVNQRYYKKVSADVKNRKDKNYLVEQFGSANWLIRALKQRADTMLKVGSELVKQQDAFFRLGVRYLKPMTLKDIAAATGYHESTISRVTSGKFVVCPRGTLELKYFFTSALSRAEGSGDDVSSAAVKHHIKELIDKETVGHILSDDELADMLKERNVTVARRTVAKYREAMHIPSSPKRRRLKMQKI